MYGIREDGQIGCDCIGYFAVIGPCIADLGTGDSRKLLAHVPLENVVKLDPQAIAQIKGFGDKTSQSIVTSIGAMEGTIRHMLHGADSCQR